MRVNQWDVSPEAFAHTPAFKELILEKVHFELQGFIAPEQLREIQMENDRTASQFARDIAYRIQGVTWGREAREQIVERRTEKTKEEKKDPEIVRDTKSIQVPKTWRDARRKAWVKWASGKAVEANEARVALSGYEGDGEEEDRKAPLKLRFLEWHWNLVSDVLDKHLPYKEETILTQSTRITNITVTHVTKPIEVYKHWHTCPHIGIDTKNAHYKFLMDDVSFQ